MVVVAVAVGVVVAVGVGVAVVVAVGVAVVVAVAVAVAVGVVMTTQTGDESTAVGSPPLIDEAYNVRADLTDPQAGWRDYGQVLVILTRLHDRAKRKGDRRGAWQFNEAIRVLLADQDACQKALQDNPTGRDVGHLRDVSIAFLDLIERVAACVSKAAQGDRIPGDWIGRCRVLAAAVFDALGRYST